MASEIAFVLINPHTIAKSRTGGVIGRFLSRTGLELVAARFFAPPAELVAAYADILRRQDRMDPETRGLLVDYVLKSYAPDPVRNMPRRVMMILLEGENAVSRVNEAAGPVTTGGGESIRDTYGDYVVDANRKVQYFEPAVLVAGTIEEARDTLRLWSRYSASHGGWVHNAADVAREKGWERTLVLIKPDNFRFPTMRPGNIIDLLSRSGLRILAAKVHRMSVREAEEFYQPVRDVLRGKFTQEVGERAAKALEEEFGIPLPEDTKIMLRDRLSPLIGDEMFNQIIKFMTGCYPPACPEPEKTREGASKCLALAYGGVNAVAKIRQLLGPTDPNKAQPGSVRREFGHDIMVNAAHASDSIENAERELSIIRMDEDAISPWVARYFPA
jgi:nucleoside diphosphate kinase